MSKKIFKTLGYLLAVVVLVMTVGAPRTEAGVGCGRMGYWLGSIESCSSLSPTNCIVVCAY